MCMLQGTQHFKEATAMTYQLHLGQIVRNLGIIAKVIGFHEITGDPILRPLWNDGTRWLADAARCEPMNDSPAECLHQWDGLMCFG